MINAFNASQINNGVIHVILNKALVIIRSLKMQMWMKNLAYKMDLTLLVFMMDYLLWKKVNKLDGPLPLKLKILRNQLNYPSDQRADLWQL